MSRTYKDRPSRLVWGKWDEDRYRVEYDAEYADYYTGEIMTGTRSYYLKKAGFYPKIKRHTDSKFHWVQNEPSWWTRMFMNRPQRSQGRMWERNVVGVSKDKLIDVNLPNVSRKPHLWYW